MSSSISTRVRDIRITNPGKIARMAAARRRSDVTEKMMIVAADHPARGILSVGDRNMAMADRGDLLERLVAALVRPGVDGVLGTPDILEDLLLLGALEGKVVFGSMNRGGLLGASFELDDGFTAYDAQTISDMGFEGGKMLTRISFDDPGSLRTLEATASAISDLARLELIAMVEPFICTVVNGRVVNDLSPDAVIRSIAIASGLGSTSSHTWLKLPVVEEMERVITATTLPVLLLGGDPRGPVDETYALWQSALELPGVQGLMVGRTLLYPPDDDVATAVDVAAAMVHTKEPG